MKSQLVLTLLGFLAVCNFVSGGVHLEHLSTLYLPYSYRPSPTYIFNRDVAEQSAYDADKMLLYTVGNDLLHVIDVSTPDDTKVIYYSTLKGGELTDIETCRDFVAVAFDNEVSPLDGQVVIYRGYDFTTKQMERLHTIKVGALPDMLKFTFDCRKIVVALEGELRMINNTPVDPEGGVAIIRFLGDDPSSLADLSLVNFTKFNFMSDEYVSRGVRWVYHGEGTDMNTTFSQDLEPEYVTINGDETKAYVVLEENNAIAEVDIINDDIIDIHPLGSKSWKGLLMDTSDRDGGINLRSWPLQGLYQPDALKHVTIGGRGYIITANEGEEKEYEEREFLFEFTDGRPGKYFVENNLLHKSVPEHMRKALADDSKLGRLRLSTLDGKDSETGQFKELYTYGGRSFSIWDETDMSLVYDSGDELERRIAEHFPGIFNSDGQAENGGPGLSMDGRSKKKGPESETFDIGEVNGKTVIFVANERPGAILVYSFPNDNVTTPVFESAHYAGGRSDTWEALFARRETRDVDPEDIRFIPDYQSPNGKPMLIVSGTTSGTVSIYQVMDSPPRTETEESTSDGLPGLLADIGVSTI